MVFRSRDRSCDNLTCNSVMVRIWLFDVNSAIIINPRFTCASQLMNILNIMSFNALVI